MSKVTVGETAPVRMVVMGVSGTGKSTVGVALALALSGIYRDGDDLHPPANVAKMARGEPLTDGDRAPWLAEVAAVLGAHPGPDPLVIGCSALKRQYRDIIRAGSPVDGVTFVHLTGARAVIAGRMAERTGHFMPPALLDSQFAALEPPGPDENVINVDIDRPVAEITAYVMRALATGASPA